MRISIFAPLAVTILTGVGFAAGETPLATKAFLQKYCFECHGPKAQEGDVRLDNLAADFASKAGSETWGHVFSKLEKREMPPKEKTQPKEGERQAVLDWLGRELRTAVAARHRAEGRVALRRLNRLEYQNTIHDLLGIEANVMELLPEDGSAQGFDKVSSALTLSPVQVEKYLEAADIALDAALGVGTRPKFVEERFPATELLANWENKSYRHLEAGAVTGGPIRRMVCCCTTLGIHVENLFPAQAGRDFELTPYLEPLQELRREFTLFSGVSHPEVDGGHSSEACFLTAAPHPGASSFRNTISLDQLALEKLPPATRFGSLALNIGQGGTGLSVSRSGVKLPTDGRPSEVFQKLFINGPPREVARQTERLRDGRSIMDRVADDAKRLQQRVTARDREKLDDYFTTVREVEQRMQLAEEWAKKPKPAVDVPPPTDVSNAYDFVARTRMMFDLAHLALQTDSTRFITLMIQGHNSVPPVQGVTIDWHNLSHHGKDPEKLAQLRVLELEQMKLLAGFLAKLKASRESGGDLLANTMVLYGSNLGNGSSHDTKNMPMLLAGGGFKHGQHLAFDPHNNTPLGQLYVSMLQRL